ncbi:MAG: hypothetical protein ACI4JN_07750, partial [Ruminococcus sp.]
MDEKNKFSLKSSEGYCIINAANNRTIEQHLFRRRINMVKLLVGHKGSGKTKQMIDLANES